MIDKIAVWLTVFGVLLHASVGCCAHHAHVEGDLSASCDETHTTQEQEYHHSHCHHHHGQQQNYSSKNDNITTQNNIKAITAPHDHDCEDCCFLVMDDSKRQQFELHQLFSSIIDLNDLIRSSTSCSEQLVQESLNKVDFLDSQFLPRAVRAHLFINLMLI